MSQYITDNIECSSDDSDQEYFDKENSYAKNPNEENSDDEKDFVKKCVKDIKIFLKKKRTQSKKMLLKDIKILLRKKRKNTSISL